MGHDSDSSKDIEPGLSSISSAKVSFTKQKPPNDFPDMFEALPWIGLMGILALVLSLAIVIAVSRKPKVVIYGMLILTSCLIVAGIIGGMLLDLLELTIISIMFGLLWGIFLAILLFCYRDQF